jgi:PLP dependent protein
MLDIRANLGRVQKAVARACARADRSPDHVLVIAVSKTMEAERIRLAIEAGIAALGENRVQEAKEKIAALGHPVPWHLIGSLQTNKARDAARLFEWIHSVDRIELARELSRRAGDRVLNVLLQVNLGDEPQKAGIAPAEVKRLAESVAGLPGLRVRGLMAIPPVAENPEHTRPHFRRLRELRDELGFEHCSMGMSADYEIAIEEGATMVRVGTAIFGPRTGPVSSHRSPREHQG